MKRNIVTLGIIALLAVMGFLFAACGGGAGDPPGGSEDYVVTFGLVKIDETSFKIEIDGASWKPWVGGLGLVKLDGIKFFPDEGDTVVITATENKYADAFAPINTAYFSAESIGGNRDPRIINLNSSFVGMDGTLTLDLDNPASEPVDVIGTRPNIELYTYKINPSKASIEFTYIP